MVSSAENKNGTAWRQAADRARVDSETGDRDSRTRVKSGPGVLARPPEPEKESNQVRNTALAQHHSAANLNPGL